MKAADYRRSRQEAEPTGDVTLPSGAVFKMRRVPLDLWMAAGLIPQSFLRAMLEAQQGGPAAKVAFSTEETLDGMEFLTRAVIYAALEPKLALTPATDEELALADLAPEDFQFLIQWVQNGCPGVPVRTLPGKEVELDRLARFRQKFPGGGNAGAGLDGEQIRDSAEQAAEHIG
jgi:hypothetical protein